MKFKIGILIWILLIISCQTDKEKIIQSTPKEPVITKNLAQKNIEIKETHAVHFKPTNLTKKQIDSIVYRIDSLVKHHKLQGYSYINKSYCGGALDGYYQNKNLLLTDSNLSGELGYVNRKMYWEKEQLVKIIYYSHLPDWEKMPKDSIPSFEKIPFLEDLYEIVLAEKWDFKKIKNGKIVSKEIDSTFVKQLIDCGFSMKRELETKKKSK
ncbi:MAG: hypothetical protein AB8B69_20070 [Chitinophagales bacterium]